MMGNKIIIIGGVAGGATTAARLRRLDETAEIIIMEKGDYISYANCGLPYHIGDIIKEREALLLQTPQIMRQRFNIDVRTGNEVMSIDKENKNITVKKKSDGSSYVESYDKLVISTGSSPIIPHIDGIENEGIFTLWNIPDTDRIKEYISQKKPTAAAVIGGGFIGLEMAENLKEAGCRISLIEMQNQVMAPIDFEMAELVHENLEMNGVDLILSDGVKKFRKKGDAIEITLSSGKVLETDLVILSIGIKPNSSLAKEAGLQINEKGGIIVDGYLKTSDENIYAVGDVIEVTEFIRNGKTMVPLAGPANKQARICAGNIAWEIAGNSEPKGCTYTEKETETACCTESESYGESEKETYEGTQGTSVAKVFDLTVASTGINEKSLKSDGKTPEKDYFTVIINQKSHAGYYPGAVPLTLKLIFSPKGKIFGAQIVGQEGVDKRIDVIASAIRLGGTVWDLKKLELAYAPPYSSAKDPVNMLGFTAENVLKKLVHFIPWDGLEDRKALAEKWETENVTVLDVTESFERMAFAMEDSVNIPFGQIRERIHELDRDSLIVVYCAVGVRSYNAARILMNSGFKKVAVYPAGSSFYKALFRKKLYNIPENAASSLSQNMFQNTSRSIPQNRTGNIPEIEFSEEAREALKKINGDVPSGSEVDENNIIISKNLDCSGLQCPGPIMRVFNAVNEIEQGQIIKVSATDMGFARDIDAWCKRTGNTLLKTQRKGKENIVYIQKGVQTDILQRNDNVRGGGASENINGRPDEYTEQVPQGQMAELPQGKTMVVFSGDLDKVLASFIIANGAAAMGRPVTMFFTFWGLNALRKQEKIRVKKPLIDSMFGMLMPRGSGSLKLSKMNMAGMGTKMMRKVMNDKNVDSLEDLMKSAMANGVKLVACTMSMDVMGITKEELIEGVEYAGVAAYLGDAENANVNLFI